MPAEAITGARATAGTQGVLAAGIKPDLAVDVAYLEPNSAPLLRFTSQLNKRRSINSTFSWWEDEPFPYWDAVNGDHTAGATTVTVDNGGYFAANYLVHVPRTGETMLVTAVSGNDLTVTRGAAGTTAAALQDDDDLRVIGTAYAEGSRSGTLKSTKKTEVENHTQIFRDPFGATGSEEASEMYWGNDRNTEREEWGIDHAIRIESAFLFGTKSQDTSGATPRRTTGGVIEFISTNSTAINGFLDLDVYDEWIRDGTRYNSRAGRRRKWNFASRVAAGAINTFARDVLRTVPADQTFGVHVENYKNIHGEVMLIEHNLLEDNPLSAGLQSNVYGGYMLLIDPESPRYRFLQGRDTSLKRDIHENDFDGWKDEYFSDIGLEFRQERFNSIATGIQG